jgi:3D (Asp-Asp-Asp) domain-containing protein
MSLVALVAAVLGMVVSLTAGSSAAFAANKAASSSENVYLTAYGWYDNTPPGCAISYPDIHQCAGGTGTYSDPITFASDKSEIKAGTKVYVPRVQKYFIMEDDCTECDQDWSGQGPDGGPKMWHFDLWIGGQGGNEFDAINCEDALTLGDANGDPLLESVTINPPSTETVSSQPLFNTSTGECYGNAQPTIGVGTYKNNSTKTCLTDTGNSSSNGAALSMSTCGSAADQQFSNDGAFLMINNLCVNNPSGSKLDLATCTGGPSEQWETNPDGTIDDIQTSTKCFRASGSTPSAANCSGSTDKWTYNGT